MCQLIWNLKMLGHLPGSSFPLCPVFLATTLRCTSCQRQQHVELRPRSKIKLFILYFNLLLKILATSQPYCFKLYICTDIDLMKHKYYEEKKLIDNFINYFLISLQQCCLLCMQGTCSWAPGKTWNIMQMGHLFAPLWLDCLPLVLLLAFWWQWPCGTTLPTMLLMLMGMYAHW